MGASEVLALVGVFQGLLLVFAILGRDRRARVNQYLAAVALLLALRLAPGALLPWLDDSLLERVELLSFPIAFLFGPFLWLYVRSLTGAEVHGRVQTHLIPFAVVAAVALALPEGARMVALRVASFLVYGHIGIYLAMMLVSLRRFARAAKRYVSNTEHVELTWLRTMVTGSITLLMASFVNDLFRAFSESPTHPKWLPYAIADLFLFGISYLAIRQPESHPDVAEVRGFAVNERGRDEHRYSRNRLGEAVERTILETIDTHVRDTDSFRRDDLKISDLAGETGHSSHTISMVLNLHRHETFYQFVNRFRIDAAKHDLADSTMSSRSILEISLRSGFRSKSTFNRVFREATGQTPSEYRSTSLDRSTP